MASKDQVQIDIIIDDSRVDAKLAANRSKLENFRQQIVLDQQRLAEAAAAQSTDVFRNLASQVGRFTAQQKAQLSFQVNDILTGLASGQNPLQILAQQGGQIFQVFQQAKLSQEGTAAATAAAATSEAAFAASAKSAAVDQAAVAVSSQSTATAMEGAAASSTVLGASVVSLGAVLAAGLVTVLAVWRATKDIEEAAKKRLATEEKITAEWNRQHSVLGDIKKMLDEAAKERNFNQFVSGSSLRDLGAGRAAIQAQLDASVNEVTQEMERRQLLAAQGPGLLPSDFVARAAGSDEDIKRRAELQKQLGEQLKEIDAQIAAERLRQSEEYKKNLFDGVIRQGELARKAVGDGAVAQAKAEQELAEKRKKLVEESIRKAKEWAEHVRDASKEVLNIFESTSGNPFVKIFTDGEQAVQKMREATAGLGSDLQAQLAQLINTQTALKSFQQQMNNSLRASDLRREAAEFRSGGTLQDETATQRLARQLAAIGAQTGPASGSGGQFFNLNDPRLVAPFRLNAGPDFRFINGGSDSFKLNRNAVLDAAKQRQLDQEIIRLTQGIDPSKLSPTQNALAARAREREAAALEKERTEAAKLKEREVKVLEALSKAINDGAVIKIINGAPDRAEVTQTPSAGDTNSYYGGNR